MEESSMIMELGNFVGHAEISIDDKNRISIPSSFRKNLQAKEVVILKWTDPCLYLFTSEVYIAFCKNQLEIRKNLDRKKIRKLQRALSYNAITKEIDKQWRLLIPKNLLSSAEIKNDMTIVGNGSYIELWNKEKWSKEESELVNIGNFIDDV